MKQLCWATFLACSSLTACATLPEYRVPLQSTANAETPVQPIKGIGGKQLSAAQTKAILDRLSGEGKTDLLSRHAAFMASLNPSPLIAGNAARLLINGPATHAAMMTAIQAAHDHINLETYIFEGDEAGQQMAQALIAKKAQGVAVNVLYDAVGSLNTPIEFFDNLRKHDINVCIFNPINPLKGKTLDLNQRDHRKLLIIDGASAFAGGINISNVYSSAPGRRIKQAAGSAPKSKPAEAAESAQNKPASLAQQRGWRDTHVEIKGPAVQETQKLFLKSWSKQDCPEIQPANYLHATAAVGDKVIRVLGSSADQPNNLIYAELLSAIIHAEHSVHITMAYFAPDPQFLNALKQAASRGVDVVLILPGFSDSALVLKAAQAHYSDLMKAGVKIYERNDALLHAKTLVVDGVWSTIGSSNLDWRSFLHNDEVNVIILGESFGEEMESMFTVDRNKAKAIDPKEWNDRGMVERFKEWGARLWDYWL